MITTPYYRFLREAEKNYGLTKDDLREWRYAGGRQGRHRNWYKLLFPNEDLPTRESYCVCGAPIQENCFIYRETEDQYEI